MNDNCLTRRQRPSMGDVSPLILKLLGPLVAPERQPFLKNDLVVLRTGPNDKENRSGLIGFINQTAAHPYRHLWRRIF